MPNLQDKLTAIAVDFGEQTNLSMVSFVTDNNVELTVEKASKMKLLLNSMAREWLMQIQWKLDELNIDKIDHIGIDSYGNIVYTIDSEEEDHKTLEFEPDVWVSN